MEAQDSNSIVQWRINKWFPDFSQETLSSFKIYLDELIKHNRSTNLISVKTIPVADALHFSDSILASQLIYNNAKCQKIFDIGSGNGFPGLIFAILYPSVQVELIDLDIKKCNFLNHIKDILNLSNVTVTCSSIERLSPGTIDCAMVRGLGTLTKTLLTIRKNIKKGGIVYHLKTDIWSAEVSEMPSQLCSTFEPALLSEYKLPGSEVKFAVLKTTRINND